MFLDQKADGELVRLTEPLQGDALLKDVIGWLHTQPAKTVYNYANPEDCVLCRYFKARGFDDVAVTPDFFRIGLRAGYSGKRFELPRNMGAAEYLGEGTYGSALRRLAALA